MEKKRSFATMEETDYGIQEEIPRKKIRRGQGLVTQWKKMDDQIKKQIPDEVSAYIDMVHKRFDELKVKERNLKEKYEKEINNLEMKLNEKIDLLRSKENVENVVQLLAEKNEKLVQKVKETNQQKNLLLSAITNSMDKNNVDVYKSIIDPIDLLPLLAPVIMLNRNGNCCGHIINKSNGIQLLNLGNNIGICPICRFAFHHIQNLYQVDTMINFIIQKNPITHQSNILINPVVTWLKKIINFFG